MGFSMVPKSVTLNDLERRYGFLWPFFGVFSTKTVGFGACHVKLTGTEMYSPDTFVQVCVIYQ